MGKIKITQIVSRIGSTARQKKNLDALGIKKMSQTVVHEESNVIKGMIEKVRHLVRVEPAAAGDETKAAKRAAAVKAAPAVKVAAPKAEAKVAPAVKPAVKKAPAAKPAATKTAPKPAAEKKPAAAKKPAAKKVEK